MFNIGDNNFIFFSSKIINILNYCKIKIINKIITTLLTHNNVEERFVYISNEKYLIQDNGLKVFLLINYLLKQIQFSFIHTFAVCFG